MLSYLALGDSYTIGEGCALHENFPYQVVQLLRSNNIQCHPPEIVAKTGWTTTELLGHLNTVILNGSYDWISLLIGVNNQYRHFSVQEYAMEFRALLEFAITKAGGVAENVFVLSIPNWGLTPFAKGRDREIITSEIFQFNEVNRQISLQASTQYIDITTASSETTEHPGQLAADGLHPSGKAYQRWSKLLTDRVIGVLK